MKKHLISTSLIITYLLTSLPLRFIFRIKTNASRISLERNNKYIIAANHPIRIDAFLILSSMPLKEYIKLLPIRFPIADKYINTWYKKMLLLPLGDVPVNKGKNDKILPRLIEMLKDGQTIFIHPTGSLEKKGRKLTPKVGTVYIEKEVNDSKIIPVNIRIRGKINLINLIKRKIIISINFKKPFRHKDFPKDLQPLADNVMRRIKYEKSN